MIVEITKSSDYLIGREVDFFDHKNWVIVAECADPCGLWFWCFSHKKVLRPDYCRIREEEPCPTK